MEGPILDFYRAVRQRQARCIRSLLGSTESPIEQLAVLAFMAGGFWPDRIPVGGWPGACDAPKCGSYLGLRCSAALVVPQVTVKSGVGKSRIDLAFAACRQSGPPLYVALEFDGHEFHERTKEQARRDKARDRGLQILGWRVLRFTGSEVWRDPVGVLKACVGLARAERCIGGWPTIESLTDFLCLFDLYDEAARSTKKD